MYAVSVLLLLTEGVFSRIYPGRIFEYSSNGSCTVNPAQLTAYDIFEATTVITHPENPLEVELWVHPSHDPKQQVYGQYVTHEPVL